MINQVLINVDNDNRDLRELLWLWHGCSTKNLYGDDGQMQCSACFIDFKYDEVSEIKKKLVVRGARH